MKTQTKKMFWTFAAAAWLWSASGWAHAADEVSPDEQAIRESGAAFEKAYNAADAKAIAAEFMEEGEFIDEDGVIFKGRDAIEKEFAAFFEQSPGVQATLEVLNVRFIGDSMAIEEGTTTIVPTDDRPATDGRYIAVHIKRDNKWELAVVRDLEAKAVSPHENLLPLAWLIGDWVDESPESIVITSFKWSEDGNFLLSDFELQIEGRPALKGTQRIGWDPTSKQVRSWLFDTEGGFGEGTWTNVDGDWIVRVNAVRPDGSTAAATNIYQSAGPDAYVWSSRDRVVDGELQPDVSVSVVRKPPAAQTQAAR